MHKTCEKHAYFWVSKKTVIQASIALDKNFLSRGMDSRTLEKAECSD